MSPNATSDQKEGFERFDESQLRHLISIIRFFDLQKEPARVERIIEHLKKGSLNRELNAELEDIKRLFTHEGRRIVMNIGGVGQLDPDLERTYDVYVNGNFVHTDKGKREEWKKYGTTEFEPYFY